MKKTGVHTCVVSSAHSYTRSKTPWILDARSSSGGRLVHYLSGGGLRAFGRTVHQEEVRLRQVRAFVVLGVLLVLWCVLYFT